MEESMLCTHLSLDFTLSSILDSLMVRRGLSMLYTLHFQQIMQDRRYVKFYPINTCVFVSIRRNNDHKIQGKSKFEKKKLNTNPESPFLFFLLSSSIVDNIPQYGSFANQPLDIQFALLYRYLCLLFHRSLRWCR